jgi:hypothetical protein
MVALDKVREGASDNDLTAPTRPHIDVMEDRRGLRPIGIESPVDFLNEAHAVPWNVNP